MAVTSVVILMVLFTSSVLQVDGFYFQKFYPLQKALESSLLTEETLYKMRQVFFPIVLGSAQEIQQVHIGICVEIMVDQALNSTVNVSSVNGTSNNVSSFCLQFLWTDSSLLSLMTIDQLVSYELLSSAIFTTATRHHYDLGHFDIFLPIVCLEAQQVSEIKTSLMLLLSWSKSYVRHNGLPPQWEESDKGYIQEVYDNHYLAEGIYNKNEFHSIRQEMIVTFTLLNILVLLGVAWCGKQCYMKAHRITSQSTRLAAVTWAFMITTMIMNCVYLVGTLYCMLHLNHPKIWACLISDAYWCASMESTKLYFDVVASLSVKLTVVPLTIVAELIISVRLTNHTLLPFPCSMATRSQCCSFRIGKRVVQTILIWNVMAFIQTIFGVALLPVGILLMIAPVSTLSCISTMYIIIPITFTGLIAYLILRWCNLFSFKKCFSVTFCAHIITAVVIFSSLIVALLFYFFAITLGVEPWSVKGSILSLLPSLLVSPLLWLAKRYFFKKDRESKLKRWNKTTFS